MGKLIIFFIYTLNSVGYSFVDDFEVFFQDDIGEINKIVTSHQLTDQAKFQTLDIDTRFNTIAQDPQNRINDEFKISPFFRESTQFWFNVYTVYGIHQSILHDRENLSVIYNILDYTQLHQSSLNKQAIQRLQNNLTENRILEIRTALTQLANGEAVSNSISQVIHTAIDKSSLTLPEDSNERQSFYLKLAENIRAQTGQRDNIKQGLVNYSPYSNVIDSYFSAFNLPKELLALAFLESSFNTRAVSRVGAVGVWQFMRPTGRSFMTIDNYQDHRLNPLISTVSALFLLQENRQILRRWDLAVVAYNSGTRHIINARRQLNLNPMTLEDYLTRYDHPHVGFASRNFYSGFLALVHTLAYRDQFFNQEEIQKRAESIPIQSNNLHAYVTRCSFQPSWFFDALKNSSPNISALNRHFLRPDRNYPRGSIVFSDLNLTTQRYIRVPVDRIPHNHPNNWDRFVRGHNCSTR